MKKLNVRSSYIQNDYGKLFQALISVMKPNTCVEIGVLDGYSTIQIGLALKSLVKQSSENTYFIHACGTLS